MIVILVLAQLATAPATDTSAVYATPALEHVVAAAAAENRLLSQIIPAYRAKVESEWAILQQDSLDREHIFMLQQHASAVEWKNNTLSIHVTSERPAFWLPDFSALPTAPVWILPALYGDRVPFVFGDWFTARGPSTPDRRGTIDTVVIEHPFSADREQRYRYSGGDTVATIHVNGRTVTLVRIHVVPHFTDDEDAAALNGDIFLDAERHQIVRVRCRLVRAFSKRHLSALHVMSALSMTFAPYIEVTNEEVAGQYWLPRTERIELQLSSTLLFGTRAIYRLMATFSDYALDSITVAPTATPPAPRIALSHLPDSKMDEPHDWHLPLGEATHSVHAADFGDLAPPNWREEGAPTFSAAPSRFSRLIHADPVEGIYTGLEGTMSFRDAAPGWSIRGFGGYAWTEHTVRGGVAVTRRMDSRAASFMAQRTLETTNDFFRDLSSIDPGLAELLGFIEPRDYVDRKTAAVSWTDIRRTFGDAIVTAQIGAGQDESEITRYRRRIFASRDTQFPNRAATPGSYGKFSLDYELHPDMSVITIVTGFGAHLHYEAAMGQLSWQRASLAATHRSELGPFRFTQRLDAGMVWSPGAIPPQQMLELGGDGDLSAYTYKQFAGDRAATGTGGVDYFLPFLETARFPGLGHALGPVAPGLSAGLEFGWTTLSSDAAHAAILAMSDPPSLTPVSVATNGARGSGGFGFTLFKGLIHFGVAHSLDAGTQWRKTIGIGTSY